MKIEEIEIEKLIPYEFNNKIHWEEQINHIANSIKEFWFKNPIIVDKNNIIVSWHWRLEWAKKLWMKKVPCIRADDLTEAQIKKFRILDNKLNESQRDIDNLKIELEDIWPLDFWDSIIDMKDVIWDLEIDNVDLIWELEESWFSNLMKWEADVFTVALVFPKENAQEVKDYIKEHGKQELVDFILYKIAEW